MKNNAPLWVPTLYFEQGLPYVLITAVAEVMFYELGMSIPEMTLWTSLLALPWSLKLFWAPFIDMWGRKRIWILVSQLILALGFIFGTRVLLLPAWQLIIILFFFLAFVSATYDAAADGFYIIALNPHQQSIYSGIRNTFYRVSMIAGQSGVIVLAGKSSQYFGGAGSWNFALGVAGTVMLILAGWHFFVLPKVEGEVGGKKRTKKAKHVIPLDEGLSGEGVNSTASGNFGEEGFWWSFRSFFRKKNVWRALIFVLFYRFAEAQLGKLSKPFLLSAVAEGGLGFSVEQVGVVYGAFGVGALLVGGILGGLAISKYGLGKMFWPMALALNVPNLLYVYLAWAQPQSLIWTGSLVALEQLGYGFGFSAYMLFMVSIAADSGKYKTGHYAFMSGFMALGMVLPGILAGQIAKYLNFADFFLYVCIATLVSFAVTLTARGTVAKDYGMIKKSLKQR